jgi:hypothetical protein
VIDKLYHVSVPPRPGFISTSPDNNNKLMRSKLNEITEYVDLNLVNAVLHKACTYNKEINLII